MKAKKQMDKGFMGIILEIILKPIATKGQIQTFKKKVYFGISDL